MTNQSPSEMPADVSRTDRAWAFMAYAFAPVVPAMILLLEEVKSRPFVQVHLGQALALGLVEFALILLMPVTGCLSSIALLGAYMAAIYYATQAYNGQVFGIPYVTDWARRMGWAE